jgi:hypothetical protein
MEELINKFIKDPRFFYLKGSFDGDGHYSKQQTLIQINVTDFDFLEEIKRIIKEVFNKEVSIKNHIPAKGNSKEQRRINFYCGKEIYDLLKNSIPKTAEDKIEYLKGLWDAEGSVGICSRTIQRKNKTYTGYDKWLNLSQKDISKLEIWHKYMEDLGIKTSKLYKTDGRSRLNIRSNEAMIQFHKLINFRIARKKAALDLILDKMGQSQLSKEEMNKMLFIYANTNFGVAYIGKMFNRSKSVVLATLKRYKIDTTKYRQRKIDARDVQIAEEVLGKPLSFSIYQSKIKTYSAKGLNTIKIKSIKYVGKDKGVDLFTPEHGNFFLSNGILSHNSTLAAQVGYSIAWMLAGGRMEKVMCDDGIGRWRVSKKPENPVRFCLEENIVFSPEDLMRTATSLREKYGRNQVIIYDEGRAGLDSARAMQAINKAMQDFFQECGQHGHVILIVLPDFFKLHEDYATVRSLFLLDVFANRNLQRGFFNFYNTDQKEKLYIFGKKVLGLKNRYTRAAPSFGGRFSRWFPVDEDAYDKAKQRALKMKQFLRVEKKFKVHRDAAFYLLQRETDMSCEEIAKDIKTLTEVHLSEDQVRNAIKSITHQKGEDEVEIL